MSFVSKASHVSGGELFYEYLGKSLEGNDRYRVTLLVFRDCHSLGFPITSEKITIGIYTTADSILFRKLELSASTLNVVRRSENSIACMVGEPELCFQVGRFSAIVDLPKNTSDIHNSRKSSNLKT